MKKWIASVSVVALIAVLFLMFASGPTDRQLIQAALKESIQASREGRPGGVMQYLSHNLTFNSEDTGDRMSIASYIKQAKPDITVANDEPQIDDNKAIIITPVDVDLRIGPVSMPMHIKRAEIIFAKESGTRFLIFPSPVWRIQSIRAEEVDTSQFQN